MARYRLLRPPQLRRPREINVNDLPIADLIRKLEQTWTPDGDTFLMPRSVGAGSLKNDAVGPAALSMGVRFSSAFVTWPGGSAFSTPARVAHGMAVAPRVALLTSVGSADIVYTAGIPSTTDIQVTGATIDGSLVASGVRTFFYWLALY